MRLTAIRLHGFKSFADLTVFPIDAAVTGIIGPNGCGKSNIIDAVRWVLGESAAKQLRGASLSDVIFAGSSGRKAAAMASVELHFDNADGSAGGAFASYAEIIVRRSVSSDGTSQYFINRGRCRRRDVVELLQGTGVGARSYAVIEQGMVSRIVESKPEELRSFVEEAAGVALYRSRRRDSERRMLQVRELLDRHQDRLQQLAKNRERLEKEAVTAQRYRSLHSELSGHEYRLQSWLLHSACQEQEALNRHYEHDEQALLHLMLDVQRLQAALATRRAALQAADAAHAPLQAKCQAAQAALQRETVRKAALQSTYDYACRALDSARQRQEKLQTQRAQDDGEAQAHQDALHLLEKTVGELRIQEAGARGEYERLQSQARQAREMLEHAVAAGEKHRQRIAAHDSRLQSLLKQADLFTARLEEAHREGAGEGNAQDSADVENLAVEVETHALALAELTAQCAALQDALHDAESLHLENKNKEQALVHELTALHSKIQTLEDWQSAPPGDVPCEWREMARLGDDLEVDPLWQSALERYVGRGLQALCQPLSPAAASRHQQAFVDAGEVPAAWRDIVRTRYGLGVWLTGLTPLAIADDDLALHTLPAGIRYLTLSGSVVSRDGFLPASSEGAGTLARLTHLHTLRAEQTAAAAAHAQLCAALAASAQHADSARESLQAAVARRDAEQRQYQESRNALNLAQQQAAHRAELAARHARTIQTLQADLAANRAEQEAQRRGLAALRSAQPQDSAALQASWQVAEQAQRQAEEHWQQLRGQLLQGEQEILRHRSWLEARQNNESRTAEALNDVLAQIVQEEQVREDTALALEESAMVLETLQLENAAHEEARQSALAALTAERDALDNAQNRYRDQMQAQAVAEERRNHRHQQLEALQAKINELRGVFTNTERKPLIFAADEQVDSKRLQESIRRLRGDIERLGAVNMAAVEAFAEVDAEYGELFAQCADLQESLRLLDEAIAELDAQTRTRLHETFATVNRYFGEYFPVLFRGGEGRLVWTDGDILNSGISIQVRPPGKNVKHLSVLSGGEKALTAIALVFSFFRLNPAPFCLLDEVDAPLDDANVARLNALLREMARDTQFVMITHHKRSMQSCDRLIGVTMSEPGVSRLVAVKFDDAPYSRQ